MAKLTQPRVLVPLGIVILLIISFVAIKAYSLGSQNKDIYHIKTSISSVPTISPTVTQSGQHCGGFIRNAKTCPAGYHCQLGRIPDAGGVCVAN